MACHQALDTAGKVRIPGGTSLTAMDGTLVAADLGPPLSPDPAGLPKQHNVAMGVAPSADRL